ncbi:putative sulfite oxidase, mitochondrial [Porphyridium purpureum]|uniref:sulfite oxidase n=1 Tax=Porphyridium purpureum TaxID=35688 RepID=A0A5J4YQ69_PORPP|nr:putative sulfite oxidase, mitochondrial [Porphyridium purpureum]|eukprot:POR4852..scf236_6
MDVVSAADREGERDCVRACGRQRWVCRCCRDVLRASTPSGGGSRPGCQAWRWPRCMSLATSVRVPQRAPREAAPALAALGAGAAAAGAVCWWEQRELELGPLRHRWMDVRCDDAAKAVASGPGQFKHGLPTYSRDQVVKHTSKQSGGIWVVYNQGIYDITEFVENHPGGADRIMLAAGNTIQPFWNIYSQHKEEWVYETLEELRVGNLSAQDAAYFREHAPHYSDPYAKEPKRDPTLLVRSEQPFTAEPPLDILAQQMVTPTDLFYKRNHLPVPSPTETDPSAYKVTLSVEGQTNGISIALSDLKKLPKHSVMSAVQCGGNRRDEFSTVKQVKGGHWDAGAISNAVWSGALLIDVLESIGVSPSDPDIKHVEFIGLDKDPTTGVTYAASVPVEMALDPKSQVLLAYEMNDEELPRDHGFPLRAVVPGVVGARNVKWLSQIKFSHGECDSHWQQSDYKSFSPSVDWSNVDYSKAPAIQEMPVTSTVCSPLHGASIDASAQSVTVRGYAYSGGGRGIIRVDVSADGGKTWHDATLQTPPDQKRNQVYGWTLWEVTLPLPTQADAPGDIEIVCKAVDSQYNVQPETLDSIWNIRGLLNNSWHRITIHRGAATTS